jgi:outer membrane protein insertion porin family/translocation and assembly module TamA
MGRPSRHSRELLRHTGPAFADLPGVMSAALRALAEVRRGGAMVSIGLCLATTVLGCVSIPGRRYALDSIDISGNDALSDSDIEAQIATRESPRFLAVFTGLVYDYEIFDRYVLERDLQRIERYYRSRGYYWPRVRAGRVFNTGERKVSVEIVVDEGPATHVGRVDVHGIDTLPPDISEEAREEVTEALRVGERFAAADCAGQRRRCSECSPITATRTPR